MSLKRQLFSNNDMTLKIAVNDLHKQRDKLTGISQGPGVYLMKDAEDRVLYVGKARNLKKRLASYFAPSTRQTSKTAVLVEKIAQFDTITTMTEKEALILESNLIKRHRPKYNVTLKDDKRYPSLRLNLKEDYPYLQMVRKFKNDGAIYFGPYSSAYAVRQTLKFVHKTFKLRKCSSPRFKTHHRSCLNYQMGTCLGPCCHNVKKETYHAAVKEVILFLKGRTPDLIRTLKRQMQRTSNKQEYEKAAIFRDKIFALQKTLERQVSVVTDFKDRDVIALSGSVRLTIVTILFIRGGFLLDRRHYSFSESVIPDDELLSAFIRQYYKKGRYIPKEILVSVLPDDGDLIAEQLSRRKGQKVVLHQPMRGEKAKLVLMAMENAKKELYYQTDINVSKKGLLEKLHQRLRLKRVPLRIECIDNSNFAGSEPVSAMVVFENGEPLPSGYRKYKIQNVTQADDYGYMDETLRRRYGKKDPDMPLPDLLLLDGGKGQLNIAVKVLQDLNIYGQFDLIAIAKKDETKSEKDDKIYKVGRSNPIIFGKERELLLFLMRIRDEAHRFVITFHRGRRSKQSLSSVLDSIVGIGPMRRRVLLSHFGSITKIKAANDKQIAALPGMNLKVAAAVRDYLRNKQA
jgi:excinuclease ABC subunit C